MKMHIPDLKKKIKKSPKSYAQQSCVVGFFSLPFRKESWWPNLMRPSPVSVTCRLVVGSC